MTAKKPESSQRKSGEVARNVEAAFEHNENHSGVGSGYILGHLTLNQPGAPPSEQISYSLTLQDALALSELLARAVKRGVAEKFP